MVRPRIMSKPGRNVIKRQIASPVHAADNRRFYL